MYKFKTADELVKQMGAKIRYYEKTLLDLDLKRDEDKKHGVVHNTQYWLAWNATKLLGAATWAKEAQEVLAYVERAQDDGKSDDELMSILRDQAVQIVTRTVDVDSRSTLVASNLAEDHARAFWSEMLDMLTPYPTR